MSDGTAIITGGGSGIGWKIAETLLERNPDLGCALVDLQEGEAGALRERFPGRVLFVPSDVTDHQAVTEAASEITAWRSPVRWLVTCAGVQIAGDSLEMDPDDWRKVLDIHLSGTFFWCQAAGREMRRHGGGAIVTIGSIAMWFGFPGRAPYTAAKAGIGGLTKVLAVEWAPYGIRVNGIAPGMIRTPLWERAMRNGLVNLEDSEAAHAMKRMGEASEVAEAAAWLLSDAASYVTGDVLQVDGGFRAYKID